MNKSNKYEEIIKQINVYVQEFNRILAESAALPMISIENPKTYSDGLDKNWGNNNQKWPSSESKGVYILCGYLENTDKIGIYIGKASQQVMGHRIYRHLKTGSKLNKYIKNTKEGNYIYEIILAIPIENNSKGFLASALEEYLIEKEYSGIKKLNSIGNN